MIRLGINTMVWSGGYEERQLRLLERIRGWGYEVVELPIFDFAGVDPLPVRRAAANCGLAVTVSSALSAGYSLFSPERALRTRTREWLERAVDKVAALGGTILAGPMYSPVGELPGRRRNPAEWSAAVEECRKLGEAIRGSGVRLALEPLNRFETHFLNTAADARSLCEQVAEESVGVLFDTFHANIEEKDIVAGFTSLGRWLIHVHLSENDRGIPGTGHVPFAALARTLRDAHYQGYAVVESFASSIPELARATAMWRDYAASPDEFARQSIENLRPLLAGTRTEEQ
jgi:D-psicose/D-tagatose/L-ribulose 3-epimerase